MRGIHDARKQTRIRITGSRDTNQRRVLATVRVPFSKRLLSFCRAYTVSPFSQHVRASRAAKVKPERSPVREGSGRVLGSTFKVDTSRVGPFSAALVRRVRRTRFPPKIPVACSGVRLLPVCILITRHRAPSFLSTLVNREILALGLNACCMDGDEKEEEEEDGVRWTSETARRMMD